LFWEKHPLTVVSAVPSGLKTPAPEPLSFQETFEKWAILGEALKGISVALAVAHRRLLALLYTRPLQGWN